MKRFLLALGFTGFLSPTALAQSPDLKSVCDRAVQWLVSQQKDEGSYGSGLGDTALTVHAMAVCPRKYREDDGPFVRLAVEYLLARIDSTDADPEGLRFALAALKSLQSSRLSETIAALEKKVPASERSLPLLSQEPGEIFQKQKENGSWSDSVRETSLSILTLCLRKKPDAPSLPGLAEGRAKAAQFLLSQRQEGLWGFPGKPDAGITALVVSALASLPETARSPEIDTTVEEGLRYLATLAKPDGSIFDRGYANYKTSIAVMAFADSGKKEYAPLVVKAQQYLLGLQADETHGYRPEDKFYGGIGYGGSQRTDLSNTQFALEALDATGLPRDHEVYRKVLIFLTRSQNFSETNRYTTQVDGVTYVPSNDGGGVYYPGTSEAGYETLPDGNKSPLSYGSMTYALLRGYLFAGMAKNEPRLQAAVEWIRRHYTLEENPGFDKSKDGAAAGKQGYFYYLLTMAKALDALGVETIKTPDGHEHRWREELRDKLLALQKPDGSWVNDASSRWWEGNATLATAYALATLRYVR